MLFSVFPLICKYRILYAYFPVKPWLQHCLQIKMATWESLNKLKKYSFKWVAEELGVKFHKKNKEEIVNSILNLNVLGRKSSRYSSFYLSSVYPFGFDKTSRFAFLGDFSFHGRPSRTTSRKLPRSGLCLRTYRGRRGKRHPNGQGKVFVLASGDRVVITRAWTFVGMLLP